MTTDDLKAIAVYLKDQQGASASEEPATAMDTPVMRAGAASRGMDFAFALYPWRRAMQRLQRATP